MLVEFAGPPSVIRLIGSKTWKLLIVQTMVEKNSVCTINSFQVFEPINLMTLGGPANSTNTLVYQIYSDAFKYLKLGQASAEGVVLLVFVLVLTVIYFAFLGKKVHYQ